jgi:hypothetical protein
MKEASKSGRPFKVTSSLMTASCKASMFSAARLDSRPYFVQPQTCSSGFNSGV